MAKPPKDSDKSIDRNLKYGDKANTYNDDKYKGDSTTGEKSEGKRPPA